MGKPPLGVLIARTTLFGLGIAFFILLFPFMLKLADC
jgi:hypothetical protein